MIVHQRIKLPCFKLFFYLQHNTRSNTRGFDQLLLQKKTVIIFFFIKKTLRFLRKSIIDRNKQKVGIWKIVGIYILQLARDLSSLREKIVQNYFSWNLYNNLPLSKNKFKFCQINKLYESTMKNVESFLFLNKITCIPSSLKLNVTLKSQEN